MAGTFLCPNTCGFVKTIAFELTQEVKKSFKQEPDEGYAKYQTKLLQEQFRQFKSVFNGTGNNFDIEYSKFVKKLPSLRDAIVKWNPRKLEEKKKYLKTFSRENWEKLSETRKNEHSLINCKSCSLRFADIQALFPVKSVLLKVKALNNPVIAAQDELRKKSAVNSSTVLKPALRDIKNTAQAVHDKVSPFFQQNYNVSFAEALSKVSELNMQHKSKGDRRRERRQHYTQTKKNIENQMAETALLRCYGGRQSLRGWQRARLAMSYESRATAKERIKSNKNSSKQRTHTGNFNNMNWDKEALRAEVESFNSEEKVNWSELARKYRVVNSKGEVAKNGGQVVKEYLASEGVDVNRFKRKNSDESEKYPDLHVRRKKRRSAGGEVTIPTDITRDKLKEMVKEKITSGEYTIGERIVPRKYEKMILTNEMKMEKVEFVVEGRKVPLEDIRKTTLKEHAPYMRNRSDSDFDNMTPEQLIDRLNELNEYSKDEKLTTSELKQRLKLIERTRCIITWHDNSTVANHGYLVCLASVIFDPAVFYTDDEYKEKTGQTVDIQTTIEKPHVHFIARCKSSESEQLAYGETRLKCITETSKKLVSKAGVEYLDTSRYFKGDSPARQFENGQQKGGNFFCDCGCPASMVEDLAHTQSCHLHPIQERVNAIMMPGTVSRINALQNKIKPLSGLTRGELERELAARRIYDGNTKKELQHLLDQEMHGIQRLPALLINNPQSQLKDLCLDHYEVLPVEPLHDVAHHIENLLLELPHHLKSKEREAMERTTTLSYQGKESKRGFDHRAALIKTAVYLQQNALVSEKPLQVLTTLVEMQRILYSSEKERCPQLILRYYNQAWYHAMLIKELINCENLKKITRRKLFGVYFHDLVSHGGLMLRLVSGQSANAEEEERIFNHIKGITKNTSNYNSSQIIPNVFVRLQAENQAKTDESVQRQQHEISHLAKALQPPLNTSIPFSLIEKYTREWQAHLMEISDFLVEGEGIWWQKDDVAIEFFDVSKAPVNGGPKLHHFRSSNFLKEKIYLQQCWEKCIQNINILPANIIRIDQEDETTKVVQLGKLRNEPSSSNCPVIQEIVNDPCTTPPACDYHNDFNDMTESGNCVAENVVDVVLAAEETVELNEPTVQGLCYQDLSSSNSNVCSLSENNSKSPSDTLQEQIGTLQEANTEQQYKLQTRLGKALEIVLGKTSETEAIDKKHFRLKSLQRNGGKDKAAEESYKNALAPVQVKVLAEKSKMEKELTMWEKDYCLKNNLNSPTYDVMKTDTKASVFLKKIKYAQALLQLWGISF